MKKATKIVFKNFNLTPVVLSYKKFEKHLRGFENFSKVVYLDENPEIGYSYIKHALFGWVKSGTTAFETAVLRTPHLTFYKLNPLTYWIAKRLVKVSHIHLANLILKREVVPELIQEDFNVHSLLKTTEKLLRDREKQIEAFGELKTILKPQNVLEKIAQKLNSMG